MLLTYRALSKVEKKFRKSSFVLPLRAKATEIRKNSFKNIYLKSVEMLIEYV